MKETRFTTASFTQGFAVDLAGRFHVLPLSLLFVVFLMPAVVQAQTLEWARSDGGISSDFSAGIVVDDFGNSYITGYFFDSLTFGPFVLTSAGERDIYVAKYDAAGNVVWARSDGGTSRCISRDIAIDVAGNSYVTGLYQGTVSFGPFILNSTGSDEIFVAKYDAAGNVVWAQSAGGFSFDKGHSIVVDAVGNSYVTGTYNATATFGSHMITSAGNSDIFVAKYDTAGNVVWVRSAGGPFCCQQGSGIGVDATGNTYVTGDYRGTATFGSIVLTNAGVSDIFVAKYDTAGNVVWAQSIGAASGEVGGQIFVDVAGNVYATGSFSDTVSIGSVILTSPGGSSCFMAKYDGSGTVLWAKSFSVCFSGIVFDDDGNMFTAGSYSGSVTLGSDTFTSAGFTDFFVAKLDAAGNFMSARSDGGASQDYTTGIGLDTAGNMYVSGGFNSDTEIGPFQFTGDFWEVFVAKYGPPPIPTVSEWGLATMTILILSAGTIIQRKRHLCAEQSRLRGWLWW